MSELRVIYIDQYKLLAHLMFYIIAGKFGLTENRTLLQTKTSLCRKRHCRQRTEAPDCEGKAREILSSSA